MYFTSACTGNNKARDATTQAAWITMKSVSRASPWYLAAVALRALSAVLPGYLHPDEVFQGPEGLVGHLFQVHALTPWEFGPNPVRSILPMYVSCRSSRRPASVCR
jgi:hypothetical protein